MLKERFSQQVAALLADDEWLVVEEKFDPRENLAKEAIFGLTNGRMGSRGSHVEGDVRFNQTLPANYIHGVFDRSEAFMRELCNTPDWTKLRLTFLTEQIGVNSGEVRDYIRVLDMKHGLTAKHYIMRSDEGNETMVEVVKLLSRAHPRVGMIRMYVTPLNYEGVLEIENIIDATVTNFQDMPRFRVKHLKTTAVNDLRGLGCYVESETRDQKLPIGTGSVLKIHTMDGQDARSAHDFRPYGEVACDFADAQVKPGQTVVIDKYAAVATGRDTQSVSAQVYREIEAVTTRGFETELRMHTRCVEDMWEQAEVRIEGDAELDHAVRFNIFHLMNTPDPLDNRVNIGAKLMHGEEYGGHAFWDTELFVLPFFDYVFPNIARKLVEYRYLLLDKALENARDNGYKGAKYPWESADTGEEECPSWTIDYDGSCYRCYVADYEHHVTADIAYGLKHYVDVTGDEEFMESMGAEILLQTARFWSSRMTWNGEKQRYEILQVTGPDEWHEPVDNNAFTNHLARWNILTAIGLLRKYQSEKPAVAARLIDKLNITEPELAVWQEHADKIFLQAESGLIEQFDGYFDIPDAVITEWDHLGMPKLPAACIGKRGRQRCMLKQADVVMLMFLLPELYDKETQYTNFNYYEQRTMHRSSLSPSIHCMVGLNVGDAKRAYAYLERSAYVDIRNNQRNTREGIHAASAGGTWQCVTIGYCGMRIDQDGVLAFEPRLPENWTKVTFRIHHKDQLLHVTATHDGVTVSSDYSPIPYRVNGEEKLSEVRA